MYKSQSLSEPKIQEAEGLPRGRVNEVCQEWMVREDGALAYRLQTQEFNEHLSGNKFRNAVVREDFPRAKSEQIREQQLAEQTAMIYQRMLSEQEEHDKLVAKQLADEIDREERLKRRALEVHDQDVARQLLERERLRVERHHVGAPGFLPQRPPPPRCYENYPPPPRPEPYGYSSNLNNSPRRQAKAMPLPPEVHADLYTEPYRSADTITNDFDRIELADEVGLPVIDNLDELTERKIQEEKDAQLARQLQEQEGSLEDSIVNRDRMLAIEAQDKELAKMLQERERIKARKARERAKAKALAKKQQQQQQLQQQQHSELQQQQQIIMPDDSYSYPADLIPGASSLPSRRNIPGVSDVYSLPNEEDANYSTPIDMLPSHGEFRCGVAGPSRHEYSPQRGEKVINTNEIPNICPPSECGRIGDNPPAVRPNQLDLRSPLNRPAKHRYPETTENCDTVSGPSSASSPSQLVNIAMAIDPTYPRRGLQSSSSFDTSSGTVTTSTSSSSPGMLPPPDISEVEDEDNVAPPYMPIQGQRRTMSLEKKQKKKSKDGACKQQ